MGYILISESRALPTECGLLAPHPPVSAEGWGAWSRMRDAMGGGGGGGDLQWEEYICQNVRPFLAQTEANYNHILCTAASKETNIERSSAV